jgi:hypothetical protein
MLTNTFCHIPGIGVKTERGLWAAGVRSWHDAVGGELPILLPRRAGPLEQHARESLERLAAGDARYFHGRLPADQQWRMFAEFRHSVAYLDIETTGLGTVGDYITAIALYDGTALRHYVHDDNLADFREDVGRYRLLVTYNGKQFDVPFIRRQLGLPMDQAHIDLRHVLHSLGYRGGLKGCEKQLGIGRGKLEGIDGFFAVLLWRDFWHGGNQAALDTLLAYNAADVISLETLMVLAYNMKLEGTAFAATHRLPVPAAPENPFAPDMPTVERLRRALGRV